MRAADDALPIDHPMRVCARELHSAYIRHFETRPPDLAKCQFVDYYIRAFAAWHVYTGSDEVTLP